MVSKNKRKYLLLGWSAAALLFLGGLTYWFFLRPYFFAAQKLAGAKLIPENALLAVSVTTNQEKWQELQKLGTSQLQKIWQQTWTREIQAFLEANNYDYEEDIAPWLGKEITVVQLEKNSFSLPPGKAAANFPLSSPRVYILPVEDHLEASEFLQLQKNKSTNKFVERTYKDVEIREVATESSGQYSLTMVENFLVIATNPPAMNAMIDAYQGGNSLNQSRDYHRALRKLPGESSLARFYVHLPTVFRSVTANQNLSEQSLTDQEGAVGNLNFSATTLEMEGIVWSQGAETAQEVPLPPSTLLNFNRDMATRLPEDTLIFLSGNNLPQQWQGWQPSTDLLPLLPLDREAIPQFITAQTGLSWQDNFLPWLDDEFALALVPRNSESLVNFSEQGTVKFGAALVLLLKAKNQSLGVENLQKLDQAIAENGQFEVTSNSQEEQSPVNWSSPLGGIEMSRSWLSEDILFFSWSTSSGEELVASPKTNLKENPSFKKVFRPGLEPASGRIFLNVEALLTEVEESLIKLPSKQSSVLAGIETLGLTTRVVDSRSSRVEIILQLKSPPSSNSPEPNS